MRLLLAAALAVVAAEVEHPLYERLIGKSRFTTKEEVEKYILSFAEMNRLQQEINGQPEVASDPKGQSFLDAVGREEPERPDQQSYLFEGDIVLSEEQINQTLHDLRIQALFKKHGRKQPTKRSLTSRLSQRWTFPIDYWFDDYYRVDERAVQAGIDKWTELTCATFKKHKSQPIGRPHLRFIFGADCSMVGQSGDNGQFVSIGANCDRLGVVTHEIGHALGMWHEQSRPDGDHYVTVNFYNVMYGRKDQFTQQSPSTVIDYGVQYDYGSVMHYGEKDFSRDRRSLLTITTKDARYQKTIGQREEPSFADVKQINEAYCKKICTNSLKCLDGGYTDPKKCEVCRCPPGLGGTLCEKVQPSQSECGDTDFDAGADAKKVAVAGNIDCHYRIKAPAGRRVFLSFSTINFDRYNWQGTSLCETTFAEVKFKNDVVVSGARICGSSPPSPITSEGQTMLIHYKGARNSKLTFSYRFDPPTPIETTTAAPGASSTTTTKTTGCGGPKTTTAATTTTTEEPEEETTTKTPDCGGRSTTTKATTTTTDEPEEETTTVDSEESTTPDSEEVTTTESSCRWTKCDGECGGCGKQRKICNWQEVKTRYCAMKACKGGVCCHPFNHVDDDGVCIQVETRGGDSGEGGGKSDEEEKERSSEEWVSDEKPDRYFERNPIAKNEKKAHSIDVNNIAVLRASRVSADGVKTAEAPAST